MEDSISIRSARQTQDPAVQAAISTEGEPVAEPPKRRARYTLRACAECKRRKVKCSGDEPCSNCILAEASCKYRTGALRRRTCLPKPDRSQKTRSSSPPRSELGRLVDVEVIERLFHLENELRSLKQANKNKPSDTVSLEYQAGFDLTSTNVGHISGDYKEGLDAVELGRHGHASLALQVATLKSLKPLHGSHASYAAPPLKGVQNVQRCDNSPRWTRCRITSVQRLDHLLDLFFTEFGLFFPCIEQDDFYARVSRMLKEHSQDGDTLHLPLDKPGIVTLAALTSMILAIAEFLDSGVPGEGYLTSHSPGNLGAHKNWYHQCRRSLTLRPEREKRHLDTVRIHVLEAMYHLMLEHFQESSRAITEAVELALCLDLNKEASWETTSNRERCWRRVLWWTLYLFDREIAQKVGRTYLIPDKEVLVDDFSNCFSDMHISAGGSQSSASAQLQDIHHASPMSSPSSDPYNEDWYYYLQFLVAWTRLKTKSWDALVGSETLKAGDADAIEAIEALLLKLKRNLPDHMQWENYVLADCIRDGVPDRKIRLRLLIFTRTNLLRMLIHHNLLLPTSHAAGSRTPTAADRLYSIKLCRAIASSTLEAVTSYMSTRQRTRSFGTFATLAIIESLYYLLALPSPESDSFVAAAAVQPDTKELVQRAAQCLADLARSRLDIAVNALSLLGGITGANTMSILTPAALSSRDSGSAGGADRAVTPGTTDSVRSPDEMAVDFFGCGTEDTNRTATSIDDIECPLPLELSFEEMESTLLHSDLGNGMESTFLHSDLGLDGWEYGSYGLEANQVGVKF